VDIEYIDPIALDSIISMVSNSMVIML